MRLVLSSLVVRVHMTRGGGAVWKLKPGCRWFMESQSGGDSAGAWKRALCCPLEWDLAGRTHKPLQSIWACGFGPGAAVWTGLLSTHTVTKETIPGLNQSKRVKEREWRERRKMQKREREKDGIGWGYSASLSLFFHRLLILLLACQETVTGSRPLWKTAFCITSQGNKNNFFFF